MGGCDRCDGDDRLSFACNECGGTYCSVHRLPESHDCTTVQTQGTKATTAVPAGSEIDSERSSITGKLLGIAVLPFVLAWMLATTALQNWKVTLLLAAIVVPTGLATTGHLDDINNLDAGLTADESLNESRVEILVHHRINEVRLERGLSPLKHDPALREIARGYSAKMAEQGFYGHVSPSGNNFEDRYEAAGYECRVETTGDRYVTGGENIQNTFAFVDVRTDGRTVEYESERQLALGIVSAWMSSQSHRDNILRPYWEHEGIGVYSIENPDGPGLQVFATQNFC